MPRTFTSNTLVRTELFKRTSGMVLPMLIEISHPDLVSSIYLVNNTEELVYDGHTYLPFAFRLDPPDETDSAITGARITFDAVDQSLIEAFRATDESPTLTAKAMFYYLASGVLTFEPLVPWEFTFRDVSYNLETITASLEYDDRLQNQMGPLEMTAQVMPGIF